VYDETIDKFPESKLVALDAGYKTPWICKKVIDSGRKIAVPYTNRSRKKDLFRPKEYEYDEENDCIICPAGEELKYTTTTRDGYRTYKSDKRVCKKCPLRHRCTSSKDFQKSIGRHIWINYLEEADKYRLTPEGKENYKFRSQTIERVFADAKEKHGMRHTMLRGLSKVDDWLTMKFAAMNLKKMATWAWA
jgi:hypothetical protein